MVPKNEDSMVFVVLVFFFSHFLKMEQVPNQIKGGRMKKSIDFTHLEMKLEKLIWKCIIPGCYKAHRKCLPESRRPVLNQTSFQRLSLSDVSDFSSPLVADDLSSSFIGSNLHVFSLAELKVITNNLSSNNLLGEGGFGPVYKGFVDEKLRKGLKAQPVAVKLLDLDGLQGYREWLTEIVFLGQLRHPNLVKLIGYCCEEEHRLLVYEYMPRGSLENQLFRRYSAALPWSTRMKIALGAAKGLAFLHEADKPVIFRDFKTSNILLDADHTPKLSDFGLAKDGPEGEDTHVTTRIIGTQGYAAPEYIMTGHLTTKSDVYGYGVVLLELLTGKRSIDRTRQGRQQSLVEWTRPLLKDPRNLNRVMDPKLEGQFSTRAAQKAALLAYKCLSYGPKNRPSMSDVVMVLETLQGLNDCVVEPFVYVVPTDQSSTSMDFSVEEKRTDSEGQKDDGKGDRRGCQGWRHRIRSITYSHTFYGMFRNNV